MLEHFNYRENNLTFIIDTQFALKELDPTLPDTKTIEQWLVYTLTKFKKNAEVTVRIVEDDEIAVLNHNYRYKNKPTNVLSFPAAIPPDIKLECEFLGDIVIAANVVKQEAIVQNKSLHAHFAHMLVHGALHLLGYDHENDSDAKIMEQQEIIILQELNFNNPYQ